MNALLRDLRLGVIAVGAIMLATGCWFEPLELESSEGPPRDLCNEFMWREYEPGRELAGLPPSALFAGFDRTWNGSMHWRSGETTAITFTADVPSSARVRETLKCGRTQAFGHAFFAQLHSEDGFKADLGLEVAVSLSSSTDERPSHPLSWNTPIMRSSYVTLGAYGDSLLSDLEAVEQIAPELRLSWASEDSEELGRVPDLLKSGTLTATVTLGTRARIQQQFELATIEFTSLD